MEKITSETNLKVKHLVKLRKSSRYRKLKKEFVIEGKDEIRAFSESGREVREIFFPRNALNNFKHCFRLNGKGLGPRMYEVNEKAMSKASYRGEKDTVLAIAEMWDLNVPEELSGSLDLVLVLDQIEKPGNLGAILRTSEAMGVNLLLISDPCVDFFNPNLIRSSRGLFANFPIYAGNKISIYEKLRKAGIKIVGTSSKASLTCHNFEFILRSAIVLGNEKKGLEAFWRERVDELVKIPMLGNASSLNINASAACLLMEFNRLVRL